jgi:SAM-dependent methyltransferase
MKAISIKDLIQYQQPPLTFAAGELEFWTDPYIAQQMLKTHLDPDVDLASRRPETIQKSAAWITEIAKLKIGSDLLDLGCGPGLYAERFAKAGLRVTGVDFSQSSIEYARASAEKEQLPINYRCQNYLELSEQDNYDAAVLIFGDFCPLNPEQRKQLLANVRRALRRGGAFILDVTTPRIHSFDPSENHWYAVDSGFWRPTPHLVLEQHFLYPKNIALDLFVVIEEGGKSTVYRNWFQDFTPETITAELQASGFKVESLWGDLTGTPYREDSEWIGVVARIC